MDVHEDGGRFTKVKVDCIALVSGDGSRVLLSGPDIDGYQRPERYGFTAVAAIVRLPSGDLLEVSLPHPIAPRTQDSFHLDEFDVFNR